MDLTKCKICNASFSSGQQVCTYCGANNSEETQQPPAAAVNVDPKEQETLTKARTGARSGCFALVILVLVGFLVSKFTGSNHGTTATSATDSSELVTSEEAKEMVATAINLNGHLCARVLTIHKIRMEDQWEVTCIEYRGGSATATYIFNTVSGKAFRQ